MSNRLLAGRYELIEKIGEGGMAVVYKARCRLLNRYVAIKILRPEFTKDEQFVENFKRESQAAASLSHPNIVSVYDVGKEGNISYIVMELIEGKTLSDVIKAEAPMEYRKVIEITRQVASALSLAHKNHIIHRDIKPNNILITPDGTAKLADFGIAKAMTDATLISGVNKIVGSVHYFSPEQARGSYVDERSDIYSLGIVMYEMLTGEVPFDGDNPVSIALMHINNKIVAPSELVSGIPPALEKLVLKATDKFQSNRYKSADELIEDLENIEFVTKMVGNSVFMASGAGNNEIKDKNESTKGPKPLKTKNETEDVDATAKKKKKKIFIIAAILICAIPLLYFGLSLVGLIGNNQSITVPDLTGYTYEKAQTELESLGLNIQKGDEVYSSDIDEGLITAQTPSADSEVKKDKTIIVDISKGKKDGAVPKVVGKDYDEVEAYLNEFGFELGIVKSVTSAKPENQVISQSPSAGTTADTGSKIDIVISDGKGEKDNVVPSLLGVNIDEAKAAILAAGFTIGYVSYEESTAFAKDCVMIQEYGANTMQKAGIPIDITVSKGTVTPNPTPDPNSGE